MRRFLLALLVLSCRGKAVEHLTSEPLRVEPATLELPEAWVGDGSEGRLELTNPNTSQLELAFDIAAPFELDSRSLILAGGSTARLSVKFRPTAPGPIAGLLKINAIEVPVSGQGMAVPDCASAPACQVTAFNPRRGVCETALAADGTACTSASACFAMAQCNHGECRGTLSTCDDHDLCTIDLCGATGCTHSGPISCPALADPCQQPVCVPSMGCTPVPVADGVACGPVDCVRAHVCLAGKCAAKPAPSTPACTAWEQEGYLKASNSGSGDAFGNAVTVSADGNTIAVAAWFEDSVDRTSPDDNSTFESGAVYVFHRQGIDWTQEAFLKASNPGSGDHFGTSLGLSGDGSTLVVGADGEDSDATATQGSNSAPNAGAAYVFVRSGSAWVQQAYLKASNAQAGDHFGASVAISSTGNQVAVGAPDEDSGASEAGAVYAFERGGISWSQSACLKASNPGVGDRFGASLALGSDGNSIAVGAPFEDSNGAQTDDSVSDSGAVYVFRRSTSGSGWSGDYLKASSVVSSSYFGTSVSLGGSVLAIGAPGQESVHVFTGGVSWVETIELHASNGATLDGFGNALAVAADGSTIAVAAAGEDSSGADSGAAYVFRLTSGFWTQLKHLKASNHDPLDGFGSSVALSADGTTLVLGAIGESSNANHVEGDQANNSATYAGAAYVF
jgi:hypothetical protein